MVCMAMNENKQRFFTFLQDLNQRRVKMHVSTLFEEQGIKPFLTSCNCKNIKLIFQLEIQNTYNLSSFKNMGFFVSTININCF
jgi:hypothetical protein